MIKRNVFGLSKLSKLSKLFFFLAFEKLNDKRQKNIILFYTYTCAYK